MSYHRFVFGPLILILALAMAVLMPRQSAEREPERPLPHPETSYEFRGQSLEEICSGYHELPGDIFIEVHREMTLGNMDLADGLIDGSHRHARSAAALIEAARLCGGQTVEDLYLAPEHLIGLGMMKGEKP